MVVYQGATFDTSLQFQNPDGTAMDLTGRTAAMQMRQVWFSDVIIFSLTTENGGISIDGPNGIVSLYMSASDTTVLPPITGVYDLYLFDNQIAPPDADRFLMGNITISAEVTRS